MKILVIQQKMIGDVLTSSILFEALRKKFPDAELHYLIQPHTSAVVENNPFIDRLVLFDPENDNNFLKLLKFSGGIKKENYDVVIDVYSKINSAIITAFSGALKKIGYSKWYTSTAYTHTFNTKKQPETNAGVAIENRMLLLQAISPDFPVALKPKIYLTESEISSAKDLLKRSGISRDKPLYMISILGSSPEKTYPLKYMAEILDTVVTIKEEVQLLFNYIPSQEKEARQLYNLCSSQTRQHIFFDVYAKNLRGFMAITSQCHALIGNEGGAVNMAKALDVPTFAIFSPWIRKEAWSLFENDQNVVVHLKDYKPEVYGQIKDSRKQQELLYDLLAPDLFFKKIKEFLDVLRK